MLAAGAAWGAQTNVVLQWQFAPDGTPAAGAILYHGLQSHVYTASQDVGRVTQTVYRLEATVSHYFAVSAYAANKALESDKSLECVWDKDKPMLSGPLAWTLYTAGTVAPLPDLRPSFAVTDNYSVPAKITLTQAPLPGALLPIGQSTAFVTATDEAGNVASNAVPVVVYGKPGAPVTRDTLVNRKR